MATSTNKLDALRLLLGEETANEFLGTAAQTQKGAEMAGITHKEESPTIDELMQLWDAYKEAEAEIETEEEVFTAEDSTWETEKAEPGAATSGGDNRPVTRAEFTAAIGRIMAMIKGGSKKEADEETAVFASQIETMKAQQDALKGALAEAMKELKELKGTAPRGANGYRATMHSPTIEDNAPRGDLDKMIEREKAAQQLGAGVASMLPAAQALSAGLFNGEK